MKTPFVDNLTVSAVNAANSSGEYDLGKAGLEGGVLSWVDVQNVTGSGPIAVRISLLQRGRTFDILADWTAGTSGQGAHRGKVAHPNIPILRGAILQVGTRNDTGTTRNIGVDFMVVFP